MIFLLILSSVLLMPNSFCKYITWYVYVAVDLDMLYFDD